jgi:hypothetical protein
MKRGTPDHPKVHPLAEALGVRRPVVLGHLELLFHFAAVPLKPVQDQHRVLFQMGTKGTT